MPLTLLSEEPDHILKLPPSNSIKSALPKVLVFIIKKHLERCFFKTGVPDFEGVGHAADCIFR